MIYLTNSFSVHMIPRMNCGEWEDFRIRRITSGEACEMLKGQRFRSYFGHVDTVKWLERYWRMKIPVSRELVEFRKGDVMIIATVSSKREWEKGKKNAAHAPGFTFYLAEYR